MHDRPLIVIHSFPTWLPQTQTWMYNQLSYLPPSIEPHVVCEETRNLDQFQVPHLHSLAAAPPWRRFWDKLLRKLRVRRHLGFLVACIRRLHTPLVHSHFGHVAWVDVPAIRHAGVKFVATFYGQDVNFMPRQDPRWRSRYKELFQTVDRVLCEGAHMAACIVAMGCPASKVLVHHLGVRVDAIPFEPRHWSADQPMRILIAASFQEKKGLPYALEALGQFQHEQPIEVTVIGDANHEERSQQQKRKLLEVIEQHQMGSKVRFLGYQPHTVLFEEAFKHHVFLSPSITASDGDTEGGAPVSVIEMAASGMPVISTRHCDIPGILQDKVTGLLADERDVAGLVEQLRWLRDHPTEWSGMAERARAHIEAEFNATVQGERLAAIYRRLVSQR